MIMVCIMPESAMVATGVVPARESLPCADNLPALIHDGACQLYSMKHGFPSSRQVDRSRPAPKGGRNELEHIPTLDVPDVLMNRRIFRDLFLATTDLVPREQLSCTGRPLQP